MNGIEVFHLRIDDLYRSDMVCVLLIVYLVFNFRTMVLIVLTEAIVFFRILSKFLF